MMSVKSLKALGASYTAKAEKKRADAEALWATISDIEARATSLEEKAEEDASKAKAVARATAILEEAGVL